MWESIRERVTAVGPSPSESIRSDVPVGKNGRTSVKDPTNIRGSAKMMESCSNTTEGSWMLPAPGPAGAGPGRPPERAAAGTAGAEERPAGGSGPTTVAVEGFRCFSCGAFFAAAEDAAPASPGGGPACPHKNLRKVAFSYCISTGELCVTTLMVTAGSYTRGFPVTKSYVAGTAKVPPWVADLRSVLESRLEERRRVEELPLSSGASFVFSQDEAECVQ